MSNATLQATVRQRIRTLTAAGADPSKRGPKHDELRTQLRLLRALDPELDTRARRIAGIGEQARHKAQTLHRHRTAAADVGVRRWNVPATYSTDEETLRFDQGRPAGYQTMTLNPRS